jgi:hypothetical protein
MDGVGLEIPGPGSAPDEQAVAFAAGLIDRSGTAPVIEAALAHRTGRPRPLPVRAVLTALLCLALEDRPLFLTRVSEFRVEVTEGTGCRSPLKMSSGPPSCHHPRSFVQLFAIRGVVLRV